MANDAFGSIRAYRSTGFRPRRASAAGYKPNSRELRAARLAARQRASARRIVSGLAQDLDQRREPTGAVPGLDATMHQIMNQLRKLGARAEAVDLGSARWDARAYSDQM